MKFEIIVVTPRSMTIELVNNDIYYSKNPYKVLLNGEIVIDKGEKNIFSLYGLTPDTNYDITVENLTTNHKTTISQLTQMEHVRLNIKKFGAVGDGVHLDSIAIQAAIMACPKDGTVVIPKGDYYCTPIFLKSDMTIEIEKDATIYGHIDRAFYPIMPGYTVTTDETDEYYLGTWEGNPLDKFASLITGINVENVNIVGEGTINGNGSNGDWWHNPKQKKGAWRPRTIFLNGCKNVLLQGLTVTNSPAWTIHPFLSESLRFVDLKIHNLKDSSNTDGIDPESCSNVDIIGVEFSVGDDCIAIKSGKLYMGKKLKRPAEDINIRNCMMKYGHGAVVFGSEMAGGVKNIHVSQCIFKETDRGLRIKTRRGRGEDGIIDGITFKNIHMDNVLTPFVINMFYFCDPDGKSEYVWSKDKLPVDEWTPYLGKFTFKDITCHNCEHAAGYFHGLPEQPIKEIVLDNIELDFAADASSGRPAMMSFVEDVSKLGLFSENVESLVLNKVQIKGQIGDEIICKSVGEVIRS